MFYTLHYILWAYFILYPLYSYLTVTKDKEEVAKNSHYRIKIYQGTIFYLWLPILLVGYLIFDSNLTFADIGLTFSTSPTTITTIIVSLCICGYFLYNLSTFQNYTDEQIEGFKQQVAHVNWLMPQNLQQRNWLTMGVSTSAGICEEILFRGYLMYQLGSYMNEVYTIIISSIVFGLGHLYQGWKHIIRTSILGAIFAGIYLIGESLIAPIILHIAIDAYASQLSYLVKTQKR